MKIGLTQSTAEAGGTDYGRFVASLGLHAVEPFIASADSCYLSWSRRATELWGRQLTAIEVAVPSVAMGLFNEDPCLVDGSDDERAIGLIEGGLAFAAAAGADTMLLCTYLASAPDTPEKRGRLVELLRRAEAKAKEAGVAIALESPLPADELAVLVDEVASPLVGVYYDTGNAVALGFDPVAEVPLLGPRIIGLHIKDSGDRLGALHLGDGRVDLRASLRAIIDAGYDGWLMLETPGDDPERIREDLNRCLTELILQCHQHCDGPSKLRIAHGW